MCGKGNRFEYEEIESVNHNQTKSSRTFATKKEKSGERESILDSNSKGKNFFPSDVFQTATRSLTGKLKTKQNQFHEDLLYKDVLANGVVKYAAIASYPKGDVKQSNFPVKKKAMQKLVAALQGDAQYIQSHGIKLCSDLPVFIPSKIEPEYSIYAILESSEDDSANEGGCVVMLSKSYMILATYKQSIDLQEVENLCNRAVLTLNNEEK